MRALIILTLFTAFLTSCSGGKKKGVDPNTGLTKDEYNVLKAINDSFSDVDQAVDISTKPLTADPSEKAQELAKMIPAGGCRADGPKTAPHNVDHNWDVSRTVNGASCPLEINHDWHFSGDSQSRRYTYNKRFKTTTRDFFDASKLEAYQINNAKFTVINKTAIQTLEGDLNYVSFQVKDVGLVTAGLKTSQSYNSSRKGGGNLIFQLINTRKKVRVTVKISWYTGRSDIYSVNGTVVGLNVIEDLFSAYELMEIKARSANLLY